MSTRREELTREAARLFAERGFHGTSMGDLARGARRPEGLALLADRVEAGAALRDDARGRARVPRGARRGSRGRARRVERVRARAARPPARRRRAARRRDGLHARVALPRGRAPRARSSPSGARYEERWRALFREGVESRRAPHRPRRRRGGAARPLGRELGVHVARARRATRTSSPIASRRSSSTASAATRHRRERERGS